MDSKRKVAEDSCGSAPKRARCAHDTRVAAYQHAEFLPQDAFALPVASTIERAEQHKAVEGTGGSGQEGGGGAAVHGEIPATFEVQPAVSPGGLLVVRNFCSVDEADGIYYTLDSDDAAARVSVSLSTHTTRAHPPTRMASSSPAPTQFQRNLILAELLALPSMHILHRRSNLTTAPLQPLPY